MQFLSLTLASLAANLALDEALLLEAEAGRGGEVLRLWEALRVGVVLGAGGSIAADVRDEAGIDLGRRCSGGGTVLVGPGCLCYTLILRLDRQSELRTIPASQRWIMERLAAMLSTSSQPLVFRGTSDLCVGERKCSGNAQRRGRHYLLHHGTLLDAFDLTLIPRHLREPGRQPDYRQQRCHLDFVTNLGRGREELSQRLRRGWQADQPLAAPPLEQVEALVRTKYATPEWLRRR
jgi:lipoate-protein ligase A